ncbi:MAG: MerR family transcriptional regulator [Actinomycetota bacterium]|nr:MerR family transcriptional regulator [Actinomycetota bacterium]
MEKERPIGSEVGYRGPQTCKIVGITYRQLDYWTRTGLIVPSIQPASGSGTQRLYSFNDLLQLKMIKSLTDAGASLQKVRQAIEYVRGHVDADWSKVTLVADGAGVYACNSEAEVIDVLRKGQGVLGAVVAMDKVRDELRGTLRELRPSAEPVEYGSTSESAAKAPAAASAGAKARGARAKEG